MDRPGPRREILLSIGLILCIVTVAVWLLSTRQVIRGGADAAGLRWQVAAVDGCILIVGTKIVAPSPKVHDTIVIRNTGSLGFIMPDVGRGAPPFDYYARLPLWLVMFVLAPLTAWLWRRAVRAAAPERCPACATALPPGAAVCPACGCACEPDVEGPAADGGAGDPACGPVEKGDDGASPRRD